MTACFALLGIHAYPPKGRDNLNVWPHPYSQSTNCKRHSRQLLIARPSLSCLEKELRLIETSFSNCPEQHMSLVALCSLMTFYILKPRFLKSQRFRFICKSCMSKILRGSWIRVTVESTVPEGFKPGRRRTKAKRQLIGTSHPFYNSKSVLCY